MEITEQKSYASNVRATMLGLISFGFDAVPVARPNAKSEKAFKLLTPALEPVTQKYVGPDGTLYNQGDLVKGRLTDDDTWVQITPEEALAANVGSLASGQIEFTVHDATEVDSTTQPGEKKYRLRPARGNKKEISEADANLYATIRELVATNPGLAFVGSLRLRNTRQIYRLTVWDGQLVLTEIVTDEDLAPRDVITGAVNEKTVELAATLAASAVGPWDPSVHRWDVAAAVEELVAAKAGDPTVVKVADPVQATGDDLMAALQAAVDAQRVAA